MKVQSILATGRLAVSIGLVLATASGAFAEKVLRRSNDPSFGGAESLDPISPSPFVELPYLLYDRLIFLR